MATLDTEYVYLEMIRDKGEQDYEVIGGLFKGLYKKDDDLYVLLNGLKGCTECLLVGAFDFLTIEVLEKDFRNMTYLTKERDDQEQALKIVESLFQELKEAGLEVKANAGFLDVSKYLNVPEEYLNGKPIDAAANSNARGTYSANRNSYSPTSTGSTFTKTEPKPKPVPAAFSRTKSPKPTADDLAALSALLDQILAGEIEVVLPETPGDEDTTTTTTSCDVDEDVMDGTAWP